MVNMGRTLLRRRVMDSKLLISGVLGAGYWVLSSSPSVLTTLGIVGVSYIGQMALEGQDIGLVVGVGAGVSGGKTSCGCSQG